MAISKLFMKYADQNFFGIKSSDDQLCLIRTSKGNLLLVFKMEDWRGKMSFSFILVVHSFLSLMYPSLLLFIALLICQNVTKWANFLISFFFLLEVLEKPPCLLAQLFLHSIWVLSLPCLSSHSLFSECLHFSVFCKAVFSFPSTADPCQFVDHFTNSCIFYWRSRTFQFSELNFSFVPLFHSLCFCLSFPPSLSIQLLCKS